MIQIDIDMPKQCGECPLCVDYDCIIHKRVTDEYYDTLEEQYAHCPLTMPSAQQEILACGEGELNVPDTNVGDTISRQAAIEVAMEELESGTYFDIPSKIKDLPSEQPMQTNTHNALTALDCISRQAAIDAIQRIGRLATLPDNDAVIRMSAVEYVLYNLPPAQSEIIRCKDCMHNGSYDTDCPIHWNGKEYCSFAERKTDE